jgi:DNA-binding protein YbaB
MKVTSLLIASTLCLNSVGAFQVVGSKHNCRQQSASLTQQSMFGGAGAGVPSEDSPDETKQMEAAAKSMGMSVGEYKLGVTARVRLMESLDGIRVNGGSSGTVSVDRDGNNPPKFLEIAITEAGKALGKDGLSKELVSALKTASDKSRESRTEEQKNMMAFIGDEIKRLSQ